MRAIRRRGFVVCRHGKPVYSIKEIHACWISRGTSPLLIFSVIRSLFSTEIDSYYRQVSYGDLDQDCCNRNRPYPLNFFSEERLNP